MGIKQQVTVIGAKCFKGDVKSDRTGQDNHYDSTTIFVAMRMAATDTTAGSVIVQYKWGDSANFKQIRDLSYPFNAELDTDTVANAKGVAKTIVLDLKPITSNAPKVA